MNSRGEPGAAGFHSSRGAVGGEEGKPSPGTREKGEQCAKYSGVFTAGRTWLLQLHLCEVSLLTAEIHLCYFNSFFIECLGLSTFNLA